MQDLTTFNKTNDSLSELIDRSEHHKKRLRQNLTEQDTSFRGVSGRTYTGIIDAYHGETGLPLAKDAEQALKQAWDEILYKKLPDDYADTLMYDKQQPLILRQLAAKKIFAPLQAPTAPIPGVNVHPEEVIVCPYSSMMMIEEALTTIARPNGVIICPEGFYKNFGLFTQKLGLRIIISRNTKDDSFKIDARELARSLQKARKEEGELCGVLLTLPGNPVISDYSLDELMEIGSVLAEADVPIICDMAFSLLVENDIPLAALHVQTEKGEIRLYDKILSITGNSKGYNAFGPSKFGAACTGNTKWLKQIRKRLTISFQRETTHLVRAVIEHTPDTYFTHNRARMRKQFERVYARIDRINQRFDSSIMRPLGSSQGIFLGLVFNPLIFTGTQIRTSADLEYALLSKVGIDSVALDRTGSERLGVRLNIFAPRKAPGQEQSELLEELFDRIEDFCRFYVRTDVRNAKKMHYYSYNS